MGRVRASLLLGAPPLELDYYYRYYYYYYYYYYS